MFWYLPNVLSGPFYQHGLTLIPAWISIKLMSTSMCTLGRAIHWYVEAYINQAVHSEHFQKRIFTICNFMSYSPTCTFGAFGSSAEHLKLNKNNKNTNWQYKHNAFVCRSSFVDQSFGLPEDYCWWLSIGGPRRPQLWDVHEIRWEGCIYRGG